MRGVAWESLDFDAFVAFIDDMADGQCRRLPGRPGPSPAAPRAGNPGGCTAAVCAFLDYWRLEGRGPADLELYRETRAGGPTSKTFLAHVENRNRRLERRIKVKGPKNPLPGTINFERTSRSLSTLPARIEAAP